MQAKPAEVGATVSLVPLPRCLQPQPERLGHPLSKSKQTMVRPPDDSLIRQTCQFQETNGGWT